MVSEEGRLLLTSNHGRPRIRKGNQRFRQIHQKTSPLQRCRDPSGSCTLKKSTVDSSSSREAFRGAL